MFLFGSVVCFSLGGGGGFVVVLVAADVLNSQGRVAASLLRSLDMPELVVLSLKARAGQRVV